MQDRFIFDIFGFTKGEYMYYELFIVSILVFIAMYHDIKYRKIPNLLVIIGLLIAFLKLILLTIPLDEKLSFIFGLCIPIATLFLLFKIRALGAGDIKLLAVIGFMVGYQRIIYIIIYSMFIAGIYGIILIFLGKDMKARYKSLVQYIVSCVNNRRFISYSNFYSADTVQVYFSIAIAVAYFLDFLIVLFK